MDCRLAATIYQHFPVFPVLICCNCSHTWQRILQMTSSNPAKYLPQRPLVVVDRVPSLIWEKFFPEICLVSSMSNWNGDRFLLGWGSPRTYHSNPWPIRWEIRKREGKRGRSGRRGGRTTSKDGEGKKDKGDILPLEDSC